jgi:hypothetical protein
MRDMTIDGLDLLTFGVTDAGTDWILATTDGVWRETAFEGERSRTPLKAFAAICIFNSFP